MNEMTTRDKASVVVLAQTGKMAYLVFDEGVAGADAARLAQAGKQSAGSDMGRLAIALAVVLAVVACGPAPPPPPQLQGEGSGWHEFSGTWTASGRRQVIPLGGDRRASIADFNGSLLLSGPARPGVGFRAEAIALSDSATGMVGRAVWTDEHGEQVFSELRGEGTATGNRIVGTLLGGTGRYAGAEGSYEFSWRFVLEAEDGTVQGQSVGLKGRVRAGAPAPAAGGSRP